MRLSKCPAWSGLIALLIGMAIFALSFSFTPKAGTRWPTWLVAGIFSFAGIQILRAHLASGRVQPNGTYALGAVVWAAFAALFIFVATGIFQGTPLVKVKKPMLAKIQIIVLIVIAIAMALRCLVKTFRRPKDDSPP